MTPLKLFFFNVLIFLFKITYSVRVYGPGIEPTGLSVGAKTNFTVETFSAGKGTVNVIVENPKGKPEPVRIILARLIHLINIVYLL